MFCLKHWIACPINRLHVKNPGAVFCRIVGVRACRLVGSTWLGRPAPAPLNVAGVPPVSLVPTLLITGQVLAFHDSRSYHQFGTVNISYVRIPMM